MSALSAVEMALWDLLGKYLGVSVAQLLGGRVRERARIYVNGWFAGAKTPEEFAQKAKIAVARGVTAMKWDPFGQSYLEISTAELDRALACISAVREAVGPGVDLLIEGHGRFNQPTAEKIARELAAFKPLFFEEPCLPIAWKLWRPSGAVRPCPLPPVNGCIRCALSVRCWKRAPLIMCSPM